jgi:hypothetical protein
VTGHETIYCNLIIKFSKSQGYEPIQNVYAVSVHGSLNIAII